MTDETPDYMPMRWGDFQRAVGADAQRWADAFVQRVREAPSLPTDRLQMSTWFQEAMHAALKAREDYERQPLAAAGKVAIRGIGRLKRKLA